ncbi:MAG: hypothetical protein ABFD89_00945 [Bryobacteraceae bacterium]
MDGERARKIYARLIRTPPTTHTERQLLDAAATLAGFYRDMHDLNDKIDALYGPLKELEDENATLRTANNMAQDLLNQAMDDLKNERARFDWLCSYHGRTPDEWRAEIDKAREKEKK